MEMEFHGVDIDNWFQYLTQFKPLEELKIWLIVRIIRRIYQDVTAVMNLVQEKESVVNV